MKKIFFGCALFFLLSSQTFALTCSEYKDKYEQFINIYPTNAEIKKIAENNWDLYEECISNFNLLFDDGYSLIGKGKYSEAILKFLEANLLSPEDESVYFNLGLSYYVIENYKESKKYFHHLSLNSDDNKTKSYVYLAKIEYYTSGEKLTGKVDNILKMALDNAVTFEDKEYVTQEQEKLKLFSEASSSDSLSWAQYYLATMNIPNAWKKVSKNNEVIVAVIDDGLYIHHPDFEGKIWENPSASYGDSNVVDFVGDGIDNLAAGSHGTMVAGIIGAIQNNNEGIAGIGKNVKIMPLRVFDLNGNTKKDSDGVIEAINFAIDNGAHIINLSLGKTQFKYSTEYDEVIKKAYGKGVIVVIAAGNGDILSNQEIGVNLSINPIAPVCNNGGNYNKYSIGVYASNKEGWRTNWTNYGNCASFIAPGVDIVSTSVPVFNETYGDNYDIQSGTSFSAPIISGIIALGFNEYGEVSPDIVYDSLKNSLTKNSVGNDIVDAAKYLDELEKNISLFQQKETSQNIVDKYKKDFKEKIGDRLLKISKESLQKILIQIDLMLSTNPKEELKMKLEVLKEIIKENL